MTQFCVAADAAPNNNYIWRLRGAARAAKRGRGGRKRTNINLGHASLDDPRDKCGTRRDRLNFDEPPGTSKPATSLRFPIYLSSLLAPRLLSVPLASFSLRSCLIACCWDSPGLHTLDITCIGNCNCLLVNRKHEIKETRNLRKTNLILTDVAGIEYY